MKSLKLYSAKWCGPCNMLKPRLIAKAQAANIPLEILDVDQLDPSIMASLKIRGIPTLLAFDGEVECARLMGNVSDSQLDQMLAN